MLRRRQTRSLELAARKGSPDADTQGCFFYFLWQKSMGLRPWISIFHTPPLRGTIHSQDNNFVAQVRISNG